MTNGFFQAALLLGQAAAERSTRLTGAGWAVMICSVGAVLALVSFCMIRVLTLPPVEEEYLEGPLSIDTGDTEDAD